MVEVVRKYHDLVRSDVIGIAPEHAGRLLDVGGGIGATGAALKSSGRATHVVLIDQVADNVADGVDAWYAGDLEDLALIDKVIAQAGPFDTVLCLDVLEHLRDPWSTVAHIHRGLKTGGHLVISVPNVANLQIVAPLVFKGRFDLADDGLLDRTHLRWFTRSSAIALATGSGLRLERIQHIIWSRAAKAFDLISFGLFRRFIAVQYVMVLRRVD